MTYAEQLIEKQKRNMALLMDRRSGMTYQQLADKYGVTVPRAHAICKKMGIAK